MINHELTSIIVNKGQIHGALGYFLDVFKIWSNQMINRCEKLGKLEFLERRLQEILPNKKSLNLISIRGKIEQRNQERKINQHWTLLSLPHHLHN